jgi:hypothetical protein
MRAKGEQENHTALWIGFFDFSALMLELGALVWNFCVWFRGRPRNSRLLLGGRS